MKKNYILLWVLSIFLTTGLYAQTEKGVSIGKGNEPAHNKAVLEIVSKSKGVLIPRMTTAERESIFSSTDLTANGLFVYDATLSSLFVWDGSKWKPLTNTTNVEMNINDNVLMLTDSDGNSVKVSMDNVQGGGTSSGDKLPDDSSVGKLFFNTSDQVLYVFNGTDWVALSKQGEVGTDDQTASEVAVTANGKLTSTNVQSALEELQGEINTGLSEAERLSNKNVAGGYVGLQADGKINPNYLPSGVSLGSVYTAADAAAETALLGSLVSGDVVVRTDQSKTYIYNGTNLVELQSPTGQVTSVNGLTGVVILNKNNVGLSNVDNTSDADKPVSTATRSALDLKESLSNKNIAGGYVGLQTDGKINPNYLPSSLKLGKVYTAADAAAETALLGSLVSGDVVVRTDQSKTYIYNGSNLVELQTPTGEVTSVNGLTGVVTLTKSNVGLANVDNTADADKPISTATQAALNAKANSADLGTAAALDAGTAANNVVQLDATSKLPPVDGSRLTNLPIALVTSVAGKTGVVTLDKTNVGLANVDNTSDPNKPVSTATQAALDLKESLANKNTAGGYVGLKTDGKIDQNYLPSGINLGSVYTAANATEETALLGSLVSGDVVVRTDQSRTYIYNGTNLVELKTPTGQVTSVNGLTGVVTLTKSNVGLANVDNTADANKPISIATQAALNSKANSADLGTSAALDAGTAANNVVQLDATSKLPPVDGSRLTNLPIAPVTSVAGKTGVVSLDKTNVGLANVDNTSDANKPVSTATQAALDLKESLANKNIAGGYVGLKTDGKIDPNYLPSGVNLGSVYTAADAAAEAALLGSLVSGDVVIRTDQSKTYIYNGTNLVELQTPTGQVTSVNGLTGVVTLDLGTAAALDAGTAANNLVQLDATSKLPPVDGSRLTNLPSTSDADASTKGVIKLAGDLSGTADAPRIATNAVTTAKLADDAVTASKIGTTGSTDANKVLTTDASGNPQWELKNLFTDNQDLTGATLTGTTLQINIEGGTPASVNLESLNKQNLAQVLSNGTDANGMVIQNLGDPVNNQDAVTKKYITDNVQFLLEKNQANGYVGLGADGKISTNYLPGVTLNKVSTVNSETEQLALPAPVTGDVAIRTDISKNYVFNGGTSGTISDWSELLFTNDVSSVNGKTGNVTINIADIANLQDNLNSKIGKPSALNNKILTTNGTGAVVWEDKVIYTNTDDQLASEVSFLASGTIASTNVQSAIEELDNEKLAKTTLLAGDVSGTYDATVIANNAVTTAKILDANITTAKLATGAVTSNKLATDAVTSNKIADGTITTTDVANGAINTAKLSGTLNADPSSGTNTGTYILMSDYNGGFAWNDITSGLATDPGNISLANGKIMVGGATGKATAVSMSGDATLDNTGALVISADAVTTAKILDSNITKAKLATGAVTSNELGTDAVTTAKILDGTITAADLNAMGATNGQVLKYNGTTTTWEAADESTTTVEDVLTSTSVTNALSANQGKVLNESKLANTLNNANIFVGDASNLATGVAMSGDVSILNTGAATVSDLTISGEAAGSTLYFNGTNWVHLGVGTAGQALMVNTGATAPEWATISRTIADGTAANNTLRWDGSAWVQSTALTNDGTNITASGDLAVNGADLTLGSGTTAAPGKIILHDNQAGDSFTTTIASNADVNANFTLTLPATAGTADQVLRTDGSGTLSWTDAGGGAFTTTSNVTSNASGTLATDDFVFGSDQLDDKASTEDDHRMFFDKSKGAFRAGYSFGNKWDEANVGDASFASGLGTIASGWRSTAMGYLTTASQAQATAMGSNTTASGSISTAMGDYTTASGVSSTSLGSNTTASGSHSVAMGFHTNAQAYASTVLGRYNVISGTTNGWVNTDPLFVIGNGTGSSTRANAFTVLKNGQVGIIENSPTAFLHIGPTTTAAAQIRLDNTAANPTIPNIGDLWFNGTNLNFRKDGSTTVDLLAGSIADGTAANNTLHWSGTAWVESTALTNDGTNLTASGDLAVNGGDITTTATTANIVNTTATTVNIAGASTTTAIGAATGTTTLGNDLAITGDATVSGADLTLGTGTTAAPGKIILHDNQAGDSFTTTIASNADVNANFTLTLPATAGTADQVLKTNGSGALSWTTISGIIADGTVANNTLRWNGTAWVESTALINDNTDITISGDLAINSGDLTTTATTANIVNTTATAVNIAGASTATAIGAGTGTTTLGNDLAVTGDATVSGADLTLGTGTTAAPGKIILHDNQAGDSFTTTIASNADVNANFTLTLPATTGTADQVLKTDGSGALSWTDMAFTTTSNVTSNASGTPATDDFVFGSDQLDDKTGLEDNSRMFFDKSNGAFRAGYVTGTHWNSTNIGLQSFASGSNTTASGEYSIAMGFNTTASSNYSTAMGYETTASGVYSTAIGSRTTANGNTSTAMGFDTDASGDNSTAMGYRATASGDNSTAMGFNTTAQAYASTVLGGYNVISGTTGSWVTTDPLFVIGNGTGISARANAFTVLKNGQVGIIEDAPTAFLHIGPTTTAAAQIRLDNTAADPTTPNIGDLWFNGTNLNFRKDGSTTVDLLAGGGGAFSTTSNVTSNASGTLATDDFVFGSDQLDDKTGTADDARMFFDKSKGAFRAGTADATQWDDANVGDYSLALGYAAKASGSASIAIGAATVASENNTIAIGTSAVASGIFATAMGNNTTAQAHNQIAMGRFNTISGNANTWVDTDPLFVIGNGTGSSARSNAFTVLKNGQVGIIEDTPTAFLHVGPTTTAAAQIRLDNTAADPTTPNIGDLWFNGTNLNFRKDGLTTVDLLAGGGGTFTHETSTTPDKVYFYDGLTTESADFIFGSDQLDNKTGTTDDYRMFFDKSKGAFRAGYVSGTQWDAANVGNQSFASGNSSTASGTASVAMGQGLASGNYSFAMGQSATASGNYSVAMGYSITASGNYSVAMGYGITASETYSVAMGRQATASGTNSVAMGQNATASGSYSVAMGGWVFATADYAAAFNSNTKAHAQRSTTFGEGTTAMAYGSLVLGRNNVISGTTDSWVDTEPVFVIGNGASLASPANAFTVLKNGDVSGTHGSYHTASDRRLKNSITDISGGLDKVLQMRGVTFKWNEGDDKDTKYGLIAQEVEEIIPEVVHTNEKGFKAVEWWQLNGVYVEAIKELNNKVETLEAENAGLRSMLEQINARLTALEQNK